MITWTQSSMLEFNTVDTPLDTGVPEGTRSHNLDSGQLYTLVQGVWKSGWFVHYIGDYVPENDSISPDMLAGLDGNLTSKGGYMVVVGADEVSLELRQVPIVALPSPTYVTWAALVVAVQDNSVAIGEEFLITDQANKRISIAYKSDDGACWYETMSNYGQLTHTKIQ